jgi:hypothetical protein
MLSPNNPKFLKNAMYFASLVNIAGDTVIAAGIVQHEASLFDETIGSSKNLLVEGSYLFGAGALALGALY